VFSLQLLTFYPTKRYFINGIGPNGPKEDMNGSKAL